MNPIDQKNHPGARVVVGAAFLTILGALMAFTSLSTDIYLPAMPQMTEELNGNAELTITGFLIGFAIAQLIWGPISDSIGRKRPLFIGLVLFALGSVGCALSTSIQQIVFWRLFQAVGACVGPMLGRAMIRDLFSHAEAAEKLSTLTIIMAIAPIVGPLLGGQIITFSTWHSIFWLLSVIGVLMFFSVMFIPETLPKEKRNQASLGTAVGNYFWLFKHRGFISNTLCVTFFYVAAYAFIAGSPFVYIKYFDVDPQHYGWLFAVNIIGVMFFSFINRRLVHQFSLKKLLRTATLVSAMATVALAMLAKANSASLWIIVAFIFVFFSMNGIIAASATAAALGYVPHIAGSASALIGSLQYGSGIISSLLLAFFLDGTPWTMIWIIAIFTMLSALMAILSPSENEDEIPSPAVVSG